MKKIAAILGALLLLVVAAVGAVFGPLLAIFSPDMDTLANACLETDSVRPAGDTSLSASALEKVDSSGKRHFVKLMDQIRQRRGLPPRASVLAVMVAQQESGLRNVQYGDRDSLGLFQQRPSQGWGTSQQVLDPEYAINAFYNALVAVDGWEGMSYLDAALKVQKPSRAAYLSSDNYFPGWQPLAENLLEGVSDAPVKFSDIDLEKSVKGNTKAQSAVCQQILALAGEFSEEATIGQIAATAALTKVGSSYQWAGEKDGRALVRWAYSEAGVELPIDKLPTYDGDDSQGLAVEKMSGEDLADNPGQLRSGDILHWGRGMPNNPDAGPQAGVYVDRPLQSIPIGSLNVLGSNHTPKRGPQSGLNRIEKSVRAIKQSGVAAVGLQELQPDQRRKLIRLLGSDYGFAPKPGSPTAFPAADPRMTIVWDKSQVSLVKESTIPAPYHYGALKKGGGLKHNTNIPLVRLRYKEGGEFFLANTHDPSWKQYAKARYENAVQHRKDAERLHRTHGIPVFFTGDFNSPFKVRGGGNAVYQLKRQNLTWCEMTSTGVLVNAYDASRAPPRKGCPMKTTRERGLGDTDHIYVTNGVEVTSVKWIGGKARTGSDHPLLIAEIGSKRKLGAGTFGEYVGVDSNGEVARLPLTKKKLFMAMRLTQAEPADSVSAGDGEWSLPIFRGLYTFTNTFGIERSYYASGRHTGLDFAAPSGTPIRAITSGRVTTQWNDAYGNMTIVRRPDGTEFWYCHQERYAVRSGTVKSGEVIGYVGSTGKSTGPHLHLEVRPRGGDPVDPKPVMINNGLNP